MSDSGSDSALAVGGRIVAEPAVEQFLEICRRCSARAPVRGRTGCSLCQSCVVSSVVDLVVVHDDVVLAGSLWTPAASPKTAVVMHPGSGPSDRHNDVYFPPIRNMLLDDGHAVASFDKRGVGGSTGLHVTSSIEQQAGDLLRCVAAVREQLRDPVRIGAFGHSQGGWVVYEAAAPRSGLDFIMSNSGPAVSPAEQERHALIQALGDDVAVKQALRAFDDLCAYAASGAPLDEVRALLETDGVREVAHLFRHLVSSDDEWQLTSVIFNYDPTRALETIAVPTLAVFGANDRIVPVDASVRELVRLVDPALLSVAVFADGDHRLQVGDTGEFAPGYNECLRQFLATSAGKTHPRPAGE